MWRCRRCTAHDTPARELLPDAATTSLCEPCTFLRPRAFTDDSARYSSVHHKRRVQKLLGLLPLNCLRLLFKLLAAAPCLGATTRQLRLAVLSCFLLLLNYICGGSLAGPRIFKTLGQPPLLAPLLGPWSLSCLSSAIDEPRRGDSTALFFFLHC